MLEKYLATIFEKQMAENWKIYEFTLVTLSGLLFLEVEKT